jgi:putative transposase
VADLANIPEAAWREAERRAQAVRPLLDAERRSRRLIQAAAASLGLSERQTYTLLRRCRDAGGALTALLPATSGGGRGKPRLPSASEAALARIISEVYLTPQRLSPARVILEVIGRCRAAQLHPPSPSTIRLRQLPHAAQRQRGEEQPETQPVHGPAPPARFPLDLVQVDHTPVDLILVDPIDREPIGRPSLTVAIDVHSRCIAGFHLSLEAPSATSVGLCLTHVVAEKAAWLAARGIDAAWPVKGKPHCIGVDNGAAERPDLSPFCVGQVALVARRRAGIPCPVLLGPHPHLRIDAGGRESQVIQ